MNFDRFVDPNVRGEITTIEVRALLQYRIKIQQHIGLLDMKGCLCHIVPLDMKGCLCNSVKWQRHPFISKGMMFTLFLVADFTWL